MFFFRNFFPYNLEFLLNIFENRTFSFCRWLVKKKNKKLKNRATFEQPCTDFSKSGGIQISTASFRHILKNRYMAGPMLLDFSILFFFFLKSIITNLAIAFALFVLP